MTRQNGIIGGGLLEKQDEQERSSQSTANWWLDLIRPSIMKRGGGPRKQIGRTAYLDGLRGFAAFLVYWHHHQLWPRQEYAADLVFENVFGFENRYYFACLPVVRTFFTGGHFAVSVFLVISGYVLSLKSLSLIHAGEFAKLGDTLASALFRRWIRLHIPILLVSFCFMLSWHLFGIWNISPERKPTFREELWNFYVEFKNYSFVFRDGGTPWFPYNFPTWTIPVEFRGSLIIYTSLLAFSRFTRTARLTCNGLLMLYFIYIVDGWFGAMFLSGMTLCELDLLARSNDLPRFISRLEPWKTSIFYTLFVCSILLGGVPSHSPSFKLRDAPGWYLLSFLKPQAMYDYKWFYLFWAATFLVASIPRIGWLRAFFETRFNLYLGHISFALYLIHGPVLWCLGDRLYVATGYQRPAHEMHMSGWVNAFPLSKNGVFGMELAFLAPHLILLPFTLWLAEVVTKLFDTPVANFTQSAYRKMVAPASAPPPAPHPRATVMD
ncbi:acyltransferase family-domain-containing protein [Calycina marina]|uniref:Acyltransferase family-domain-containing protein n=1 Tax=Calycina marina TaxID=1763456 RepID=A0A9P7ZBH6_9HELO|nr:acyltransferase family-domain-containing protein [Calycina marina]